MEKARHATEENAGRSDYCAGLPCGSLFALPTFLTSRGSEHAEKRKRKGPSARQLAGFERGVTPPGMDVCALELCASLADSQEDLAGGAELGARDVNSRDVNSKTGSSRSKHPLPQASGGLISGMWAPCASVICFVSV